MEQVEEYIRRAGEARKRSSRTTGSIRKEYEAIAVAWELLAAERLKMLEEKLNRDPSKGSGA